MKCLLLNAGSSSLKATLMESTGNAVLAGCAADWAGATTTYRFTLGEQSIEGAVAWRDHARCVERFIADILDPRSRFSVRREEISAVGHRIVHGGHFTSSVRISPEVRAEIQSLAELAPLHNPPSLNALAAAEDTFPDTPHVAVFDTAFHATLPPDATMYAVPHSWLERWGIRRYGFHGLSHDYCSHRAAEILHRPLQELRLIVCHLGHGCSAAAIDAGRSVDTTMGFTPLDGLMMATRCGSLDPGVVLHVQQRRGLSVDDVENELNRHSGLLGVSGVSGDMRQVLQAAHAGHSRAQLAIDIYVRRVRQAVASLMASLGRLDALVFTAGVGEHSAEIRRRVCHGLEHLGIRLDDDINSNSPTDADIAVADATVRILVIATREDLTMMREVLAALE